MSRLNVLYQGERFTVPWWSLLLLAIILIAQPITLFQRMQDQRANVDEWLSAGLEVLPADDEIMIRYSVMATRNLNARWTATVVSENGSRLATRHGDGKYGESTFATALWSWAAFFDNGVNPPPPIPVDPFRVCVRYRITTENQVIRDTSTFCSEVFDPRGKT